MPKTHKRSEMLPRAEELVERFRPWCERIEIAGSIRRKKSFVKDIEIVAVPNIPKDLFGDVDTSLDHELTTFIDEERRKGRLSPRLRDDGHKIGWGPKFKAMLTEDGIPIDLFMVVPPAQWGAVFAIRTGPGDYSQYLVTSCKEMGLKCNEGALWRKDGSLYPTPEEEDFFRGCGIEWIPPEKRQ